tara:strand:- start:493 stop:840 length:348 start_codon:yes stop_codon:yes gene_type:complete
MTQEDRDQLVIDSLNTMIKSSEPIYYKDVDKFFKQVDDKLVVAEKTNGKIGIKKADGEWGWSFLSMLATVTDCLTDKRIAFEIQGITEPTDKQRIIGVTWWTGTGHKDDINDKFA